MRICHAAYNCNCWIIADTDKSTDWDAIKSTCSAKPLVIDATNWMEGWSLLVISLYFSWRLSDSLECTLWNNNIALRSISHRVLLLNQSTIIYRFIYCNFLKIYSIDWIVATLPGDWWAGTRTTQQIRKSKRVCVCVGALCVSEEPFDGEASPSSPGLRGTFRRTVWCNRRTFSTWRGPSPLRSGPPQTPAYFLTRSAYLDHQLASVSTSMTRLIITIRLFQFRVLQSWLEWN